MKIIFILHKINMWIMFPFFFFFFTVAKPSLVLNDRKRVARPAKATSLVILLKPEQWEKLAVGRVVVRPS